MKVYHLTSLLFKTFTLIFTILFISGYIYYMNSANRIHIVLEILSAIVGILMLISSYVVITSLIIISKKNLYVWQLKIFKFEINHIKRITYKNDYICILYKRNLYKFDGYFMGKYFNKKASLKTKKLVDKLKFDLNLKDDN